MYRILLDRFLCIQMKSSYCVEKRGGAKHGRDKPHPKGRWWVGWMRMPKKNHTKWTACRADTIHLILQLNCKNRE